MELAEFVRLNAAGQRKGHQMPNIEEGVLVDSVPDIPASVQTVIGHSLDKAKETLETEKGLIPFTAVLVGDQVILEQHPSDTPQECMARAKHAVEGMRGAKAYAFCYDGYVDTNQGTKDALIAEGGKPGSSDGYAIAYLYEIDGIDENGMPKTIKVDAKPVYIGKAVNLMAELKNDSDAVQDVYTEKGEALEHNNAEEFGEPLKDVETTLDKGAAEELENAKEFGEPVE